MSRFLSFSFSPRTAQVRFGFGVLFLLLFSSSLVAQTTSGYDFTVAHEPYTMLTGGASFGIQPGEAVSGINMEGDHLSLYGRRFYPNADTPIVVYGNGLIRLDNADYTVAIDALLLELIPLDERSDVRFEYALTETERVLKIEWRYAGILDTPDVAGDYVNFQLWIYQQSGVVEMRYGPGNLADNYGELVGGGPFVGIFRSSPWTIAFWLLEKDWLTGNPTNPQFEYIGQALPPLAGIPPEGTVYRFTPKVSSGIAEPGERNGGYRLYPNPTSGKVRLERPERQGETAQVRLVDALGRTVRAFQTAEALLEFDLPQPGVYYCRITEADGTTVMRSVVRQ